MKCNPWRWLWGILPLLPLAVMAIVSMRSTIEADLLARTRDALKKAGIDWAELQTEVRDLKLAGKALDEAEQAKAFKIVDETWGTRSVINAATLIDKADKYVWNATKTDNRVQLGGFVPSEKARAQVLAAVKAGMPGATVQDGMKLARGAPAVDPWIAGIGFAAKQLGQLKAGKAELEQMALTVTGEAPSGAVLTAVKTALATGLPRGVSLKQEAIKAPVIKPYTWAAKLAGDQLVLTGYVASDKVRSDVVTAARQAAPKAKVVDQMQLGEGAPADFVQAVTSALGGFQTLIEGSAEARDATMVLQGLAETAADADHSRAALRRAPQSFRVSDQIRHREPPRASPYVTGAAIDGGTVVLTGHVPGEEQRKAVLAAVTQRFGGKAIRDQMQLASGQAPGWRKCVDAGLAALQKLGNGRATLTDRRLEVAGRTDAEPIAQSLPAEVQAATQGDCDPDVRLTLENKAAPLAAPAVDEVRVRAEAEARARAQAEAKGRAEAENRAAASRQQQITYCQTALASTVREGTLNFKRASAEIDPASTATLNQLAEVAKRCPNVRVEIGGHTDADGTPERNQSLSERRARAVADYLINAGVDSAHLTSVGYGETKPIAPNDTAANKALNRRIEFTVR